MSNTVQGQISGFNISAADLQESMEDTISGDNDESEFHEPKTIESNVPTAPTSEEVNKAIRGETFTYPSGSEPLMTQKNMSASLQRYSKSSEDDIDTRFKEADAIVQSWSKSSGRGLTRDERNCLIAAVMSGEVSDPKMFTPILLGYHIRGEHNVNEVRNVSNAMQELLNGMIASHKGIDSAAKRILSGVESAIAKGLQAGMSPPAPSAGTIPVTRTTSSVLSVSAPVQSAAPTSSVVNKAIQEIKTGSGGYITDVEEFYKLTGRGSEYVSRVFKVPNVEGFIASYLEVAQVDPNVGKSKAWSDFVAYAKSV